MSVLKLSFEDVPLLEAGFSSGNRESICIFGDGVLEVELKQ